MARQYTRIYTHFNTNWETGVLAKPTFYDMTLQNWAPANSLGIETNLGANIDHDVADNEEYVREWPFRLHLNAVSDANLELMLEQCIERIADYQATNQRWRTQGTPEFDSRMGLKMAIMNCEEYTHTEATTW